MKLTINGHYVTLFSKRDQANSVGITIDGCNAGVAPDLMSARDRAIDLIRTLDPSTPKK